MFVQAKNLRAGDEIIIREELHRITVNDPAPENERTILSYVIARPRTAAFRSWFNELDNIEVMNRK